MTSAAVSTLGKILIDANAPASTRPRSGPAGNIPASDPDSGSAEPRSRRECAPTPIQLSRARRGHLEFNQWADRRHNPEPIHMRENATLTWPAVHLRSRALWNIIARYWCPGLVACALVVSAWTDFDQQCVRHHPLGRDRGILSWLAIPWRILLAHEPARLVRKPVRRPCEDGPRVNFDACQT